MGVVLLNPISAFENLPLVARAVIRMLESQLQPWEKPLIAQGLDLTCALSLSLAQFNMIEKSHAG